MEIRAPGPEDPTAIREAIGSAADEILRQGLTPTVSRVAKVVKTDRRTLIAGLETWAAKLRSEGRSTVVKRSRTSNNDVVQSFTSTVARSVHQRSAASLLPKPKAVASTGEINELRAELARQETALQRLRQRQRGLEAQLEGTNRSIKAAEVRARLITVSLQNGGELMDQLALKAARKPQQP
jgi:small-conductance mechanosensitive channel